MFGREKRQPGTPESRLQANEREARNANRGVFRHRVVTTLEGITASTAGILTTATIVEFITDAPPKELIIRGASAVVSLGGTVVTERLRQKLKRERKAQENFAKGIQTLLDQEKPE